MRIRQDLSLPKRARRRKHGRADHGQGDGMPTKAWATGPAFNNPQFEGGLPFVGL